MTHLRTTPEDDFDVDAFAARERSSVSVHESEITAAIIDALMPADVYLVAWRVA